MGGVINSIVDSYNYLLYDLADGKTKDLPLMDRPFLVISLTVIYLKFCTDYGPRFMKNRRPYTLKYPIMFYNIFQVLLSLFLVYEGIQYFSSKDYNFFCDPVTETTDPRIVRTARSCWWYFLAKITELLDTVFFVFRKKSRQISTLHLYHHSMVVLVGWMAAKYYPVGPIVVVGTLNSFIHVLMYSYYFVAGLGPEYQKYLWWKKYLTLLQIIQFLFVIFHNTTALFHDCNYPKLVHVFLIFNTSLVLIMFSQFYYNAYIKVHPKKADDTITKVKEIPRTGKRLSVGQ